MGNFQAVFLIMLSLFANLKLMSALYWWNVFSLQVGDICKEEARHIMIMIWYFISSWKLLSENPPGSTPPPPPKSKSLRPPLYYEQPPSKVWRTWPSSPLKSNLVQKSKYSFFKERKDFISNHEVRTIKGEFNFQVFYFCLVVSGKLDGHFQCW